MDAEMVGAYLGQRVGDALPHVAQPRVDGHIAAGLDPDPRYVVATLLDSAFVENPRRPQGGVLDIEGEADPHMAALLT
jgi:hypothetical protein